MAGGGSRMKKSCACCKRYLEHLGGKMSCFLIRMTTDSMHSMIIPDRFVNHFGGKIPGTIKLESPNGILYVVEVTECMNKTVLQCGWEAFVDAHHIKADLVMIPRNHHGVKDLLDVKGIRPMIVETLCKLDSSVLII
ncbi:hypothetical protein DAI22_03g258500 [Oryza sativa Japonica Group]|nr:hypothetical protein DAI22_03g258500 [Oryza sativa Japonica Group]